MRFEPVHINGSEAYRDFSLQCEQANTERGPHDDGGVEFGGMYDRLYYEECSLCIVDSAMPGRTLLASLD